jgi:PAS domain S-box-containing protein
MGIVFARHRSRRDDLAPVRLLQTIAVLANEASSITEAVQAALNEVCSFTHWPVGHAYFLDPAKVGELVSTSLWHLDDPARFEVFREISEATPLRIGVGLPGRVLQSAQPIWIRDVTRDSNFPRAHTGRGIGVRGAFAFPVLAGRDVIAVLEFFSTEPQPFNTELLELMGQVGTQLGRVAEREIAATRLVNQVVYTKHLIDSAYDAFVSIDQFGHITGWNHAAEKMFGWPAVDVMGLPLAATIIPNQYRNRHLAGVAHYLATGEENVLNQHIEITALRRDGREFPVELAIWQVGSNGVTTFCAFIHDITERHEMVAGLKEADERSRNSEQRLIAAQEMAGVGSWEWDIERNVVTWSEQLYRNFGVSPEEFIPSFEGFMSLVHPDDRTFVASSVTTALDELGSFDLEHRSVRPSDNEVRVHHGTGRVISAEGRALRMAGTNQDVTDRRRDEAALRQAFERERDMVGRLRELDDAKTKFVSSVSHELRTPLTSIIGYLHMLQLATKDITDEHRDMLVVIERNSQRLLSLIEDLLTQSRVESGSFKLTLAPTPIPPIIMSAIDSMLPTAMERAIGLEASVAPDVGDVLGDADQLERLLLNLLTNALKFTTGGGSVELSATRDDGDVVLRVTDTGIGIPPDELPRLFSPFFRSSNAEQTVPGTGLGLVIVKAIVDEHQGTIDIASVPEEGTTVTVRLPAAAATAHID